MVAETDAGVGSDAGAADADALALVWRRYDGIALALAGDLDRSTYPQLARLLDQVERGGPARVELDFSGVQLIDSGAALSLCRRREEMRGRGRALVIHHASPWVCRVLGILRMQDLLAPAEA